MNVSIVRTIIEEYFEEYPIAANVNAVMGLAEAHNLTELQLHEILRSLRRNAEFFEERKAIQYGLLNLFVYAVDAMFIPEGEWDDKRAMITAEYKRLLELQNFFTINLQ